MFFTQNVYEIFAGINIYLLARNKNELPSNSKDSSKAEETKKKGKTKEKQRQKKLKKITKKDADKDVDESEIKRHNKRKWF